TKHGELRGCIGLIKGIKPLYLAVQDMAIAAALRDPRFPPVSPSELDEIEIEISVLTPLKEVKDVEEIKVGRDGIYIERGYHSGLLLPQVATEYGWTREEFLDHTCMKAGLFPGCWKEEGTKIYRFSALIFSE
ncbi:AMMECR1 domain-containing protein, partial [bacterium]